jgi:hypothetical protein
LYHPNRAVSDCQNGRRGNLPKWQKSREICQNGSYSKSCAKRSANMATANLVPKNLFFRLFFFLANADT